MNAADLSLLLDEANHAQWESVQAALKLQAGQRSPRLGWLISHLLSTKRTYWSLIAGVCALDLPPEDAGLQTLMHWEVGAAAKLGPEQLEQSVQYGNQILSVSQLLRLNIRHSVWHAGQIAALPLPAEL